MGVYLIEPSTLKIITVYPERTLYPKVKISYDPFLKKANEELFVIVPVKKYVKLKKN